MNICIVSQQAKKIISGIGLYTKNLTIALNRDGHNVFLIVPKYQCPDWYDNNKIYLTPDPFWKNNQARWLPLSWHFSRALQHVSTELQIDLIHFTDAREAFFTFLNIPKIGNVNDTYSAQANHLRRYKNHFQDYYLRLFYYSIVKKAEICTYPRLDALIANSKYTANAILKNYQIDSSKLYICYKSISSDRIINRDETEHGKLKTILFVGSNMQRKGLSTLIEAAKILEEIGVLYDYWIVGDDPKMYIYEEKCKSLGIREQFNFLGWKSQDELLSLYRAADIFVMPSLEEAFGVAILEALAAGLIVVSSSVGGIPEIISNNKNGYLIEPDNPQELAKRLVHITNNPEEAQKIIEEGYKTVKQFTVEKMVEQTYKIYSDVLIRK